MTAPSVWKWEDESEERGEFQRGWAWFDAPAGGLCYPPSAADPLGAAAVSGGVGTGGASVAPVMPLPLREPLGPLQAPPPLPVQHNSAALLPQQPAMPLAAPMQLVPVDGLTGVSQQHHEAALPTSFQQQQYAAAMSAPFQQQQQQYAVVVSASVQQQQHAGVFQQQQHATTLLPQQQLAATMAASFQQQQQQQQHVPPLPAPFPQQQQQQQQHAAAMTASFQQPQHPQQPDAEMPQAPKGHASGGRGKGKGRGKVTEDERKARNRATQARFRERQKERNEQLAGEFATAEAELQRTRKEQSGLEAQNAALQKMLLVKEEVLGRLGADVEADVATADGAAAGISKGAATATAAAAAAAVGSRQRQQQPLLLELAGSGSQQSQAAQQAAASTVSGGGGGSASSGSRGSAFTGAASSSSGCPIQRRISAAGAGGGLSPIVAAQMEQLGHDLTAHIAMLELPVDTHPDEAMAVACARLQSRGSGSGQHTAAAAAAAAEAQQAGQAGAAPLALPPAGSTEEHEEEEEDASRGRPLAQAYRAGCGGGSSGGGEESQGGGLSLIHNQPELIERIHQMTPEDFVATWQELAGTFKTILAAHDEGLRSPESDLERILDLFKGWSGSISLTLHIKPENAEALFATAAQAPAGMWESAAASLLPTRAQCTMLRQLWHAYASRVQTVRAERALAMQAVQHAAQHSASAGTVPHASLPADTLSDLMSRYLGLFDAAGRLSTLKDAEFVAMLQLMGRTGAVFSPVQKARLAAACHPYFPDVVQMVRLFASMPDPPLIDQQQQQQQQHSCQQQGQQPLSPAQQEQRQAARSEELDVLVKAEEQELMGT